MKRTYSLSRGGTECRRRRLIQASVPWHFDGGGRMTIFRWEGDTFPRWGSYSSKNECSSGRECKRRPSPMKGGRGKKRQERIGSKRGREGQFCNQNLSLQYFLSVNRKKTYDHVLGTLFWCSEVPQGLRMQLCTNTTWGKPQYSIQMCRSGGFC